MGFEDMAGRVIERQVKTSLISAIFLSALVLPAGLSGVPFASIGCGVLAIGLWATYFRQRALLAKRRSDAATARVVSK